jgi:hypothetical protein
MNVLPEVLDTEVGRAATALEAARAELVRADEAVDAPNPLASYRRVSSRATWTELGRHAGALAEPLRRWVQALTLERVLWPDTVRLAAAWRGVSIAVDERGAAARLAPPAERLSPRDLVIALLGERVPARRELFASALAEGVAPMQDAARIYADRRAEAARQLGATNDGLEVPIEPAGALAAIAARFLAETSPLVERAPTWSAALAGAVGCAWAEGWPARLHARWLFDLFRTGLLTQSPRPELGTLPAPLGASSFARALGAFGAALADAGAPRVPWCSSRAPFDLTRHRRAALFAALAADPVFGARALGLARGRARDQARGVARALLVTARLDAARVLLRGALERPPHDCAARFEEHTGAALGLPLPPSLAGVLPRLGPEDPVRFTGLLVAVSDRRALIERFDEDWFRSPHAARAMREENGTPAAPRVAASTAERGIAEIVRYYGELA